MSKISWVPNSASRPSDSSIRSDSREFQAMVACVVVKAHCVRAEPPVSIGVLGSWILRCIKEIPTHRSAEDVGATLGLQPALMRGTVDALKAGGLIESSKGALAITPKGLLQLGEPVAVGNGKLPQSQTFIWICARQRGFEVFGATNVLHLNLPTSHTRNQIDVARSWANSSLKASSRIGEHWRFVVSEQPRLAIALRILDMNGKNWAITCGGFERSTPDFKELMSPQQINALTERKEPLSVPGQDSKGHPSVMPRNDGKT